MRLFQLAVLFSVCIFAFSSCDLFSSSSENSQKKEIDKNAKRIYREDGTIKAELHYDSDGKRHGACYNYYANGKVNAVIPYDHGQKHGKAIWYFENGKVYEETIWKYGGKDSIQVRYHKSGNLMAQIPYHQNERIPGLVEYTEDGKQKTRPSIIISEKNTSLLDRKYKLSFKLSNDSRKVKFFILDDSYLYKKYPLKTEKGIAHHELSIHPDLGLMKKIVVMAEHTTRFGNSMFLKDSINIAVSPI
ncbi:MAG: hypothetical protein K9H64_22195 [Bacteroidales bacterium]|nr:hypothetical protein [Bacteroidales bacterium]MCF8458761.1 hypothetical protein [Bacteroidales bacterium]